MSAHTPGPWFVALDGLHKVASVSSKTGIYADHMPHESSITADARLIAAAPDLLLDLYAACNYIEALGGDAKKYRQTIAKAEGA